MALVEFQANLHPVTRVGFAGAAMVLKETKLSIKIAQINKAAHEQDPTHELKAGSNWVWAIVQETTGQPDRFLSGGQSASMSEAAARAQIELTSYEARLSRKVEDHGIR
jgi:hypothetical protein